ncbi:MAG: hypothetical protein K8S23_09455 [Candidatus Cloacimonetes bacterium]|nr:hypothetical protein [Candidatus Cloacimonadota bacterium]
MIKWLSILFILLLIVGCATVKEEVKIPEKPVQIEKKLPWFISNPPKNTAEFIFATGTGNSSSSADENARANISKYFKDFLTTRYREHYESHQMNEREIFNEYIDKVIINISQLQIPGVTITERNNIDATYYSLAKINKSVFDNNQQKLKDMILDHINEAKLQNNPGKKLRSLFFATSLLPQTIYPFDIDDKMAIVYLQSNISEIIDSIESSSKIIKNHELSGKKQIVIQLSSNSKPLTSIPILFETTSLKCDSNGNYYLDYNEFCDGDPFYLKWKIDHNALSYPELNKYEIKDAVRLIKDLSGKSFNIHIVPPVDLKCKIVVDYTIDDDYEESSTIEAGIKKVILKNGIEIVSNSSEANMIVKADVNVFLSSESEYLGFCYKTNATITITGDKRDREVISLDDLKNEESTKSFNKKKEQAANNSLKSMVSLIRNALDNYLQSAKN